MSSNASGVAVVGLGVMGSAIATRLLDRLGVLSVSDLRPEAASDLVVSGAIFHAVPAGASAGADVVVLSLNTAPVVEQVVFGDHGVLAGWATSGRTGLVVDMSSISPDATREFADRVAAHGHGWVDAPLSGGAPGALEGRLSLMVGGEDADVARATAVLEHVARRISHVGGSGAGQLVKLINQVLVGISFSALAEAAAMARAAGLDPDVVRSALTGGRADSALLQEFFVKFASFDLTPTGNVANMVKDLSTAVTAARSGGLNLPVTELALGQNEELVARGLGRDDNANLMRLYESPPAHRSPVLVVMGVSGCGKSTLAGVLAGTLGWDLAEGDDLHPDANVRKMAAGMPLTDDDRRPWLDRVAGWIAEHTDAGRPGVITCSALKRSYRDRLSGPGVVFVHVDGSRALIGERMEARLDHFMPTSLLDSQFATLEAPGPDESVVTVSAGLVPGDQVDTIVRSLGLGPR